MQTLPSFYGGKATTFSAYVERSKNAHLDLISEVYAGEDRIVEQHLVLQHRLANCWVGLFVNEVYHFDEPKRLVFNAFQSNLFHLHSARLLIRNGLIGSVYPILRLIYEGLVFAKYCSLSKDFTLYRRWESGDHRLSLRNDVLNKLLHPSIEELLTLWTSLCQVTHFSTYAGQPGLDLDYTRREIKVGYAIVSMLSLFNHHILNRHLITPAAEYYVKAYGNQRVFVTTRRDLRVLNKELRITISQKGNKLVRDFTAAWQIRQS